MMSRLPPSIAAKDIHLTLAGDPSVYSNISSLTSSSESNVLLPRQLPHTLQQTSSDILV